MLKQTVKRAAHYFAAQFGPHKRPGSEPRLLILMYHRILPEDDERINFEEPGMTVTPDTFAKNIALLSQYFEFVSLSDWLERKQSGQPLPAKACAITFDDGWADNYEYAFPILEESATPATIFLVSDMMNTRQMFWPERLARIVSDIAQNYAQEWRNPSLQWLKSAKTSYAFANTAPDREQITQLVTYAKKNSDQENHARLSTIEQEFGLQIQPAKAALLNWAQINEMTSSQLVDAGSHTCHHIRLNANTPLELLQSEIIDSKRQIEQHTGRPVRTFCFPNGDYSALAMKIVKENYLGAVTTNNGWNTGDTENYLLQRIGIHQDIAKDKTAFLARISGWL